MKEIPAPYESPINVRRQGLNLADRAKHIRDIPLHKVLKTTKN